MPVRQNIARVSITKNILLIAIDKKSIMSYYVTNPINERGGSGLLGDA